MTEYRVSYPLMEALTKHEQRLTAIKTEVANIEADKSLTQWRRDALLQTLASEQEEVKREVRQIESNPSLHIERLSSELYGRAREERALHARQQARFDRIAAAQSEYDAKVIKQFNWGLVNVRDLADKREIVREHLAKMDSGMTGAFETTAFDTTGRGYVVVTDADGTTWVGRDVPSDRAGQGINAPRGTISAAYGDGGNGGGE